jgi:hypothetical protein
LSAETLRQDPFARRFAIPSSPLPKYVLASHGSTGLEDILTSNHRNAALEGQPSGISIAHMSGPQRDKLMAVILEYAGDLPGDMRKWRDAQIRQAGEKILFAWADGASVNEPHYYRVQAPMFHIEYDCTQDGANHFHSVWCDLTGDWGSDLLAHHYAQDH